MLWESIPPRGIQLAGKVELHGREWYFKLYISPFLATNEGGIGPTGPDTVVQVSTVMADHVVRWWSLPASVPESQ